MRLPLSLVFALLLSAVAPAQTPRAAEELLAQASKQAKREKKNVLVVFGASWCGWCKRLDAMLAHRELRPVFERAYVVVHLDVLEHGEKEALENPGGEAMLSKLGGADSGLPFYAVLSPAGKALATSLAPTPGKPGKPGGSNVGFPAAPHEIAHFMGLLRKTAPRISASDRTRIETYLQRKP